eukprot:4603956-Pleurochrysis_carterae.AAC.1
MGCQGGTRAREPRPWCKTEPAIFFIARSCWYVACMHGERVTTAGTGGQPRDQYEFYDKKRQKPSCWLLAATCCAVANGARLPRSSLFKTCLRQMRRQISQQWQRRSRQSCGKGRLRKGAKSLPAKSRPDEVVTK